MTYDEIIGQVASNMGYEGLSGQLERNVKFAMFWAIQELTSESNALKEDITFATFSNKYQYPLPQDFLRPRKVLLSQEGVGIPTIEVEYEELLVFKLGLDSDVNARYSEKTVFAFRKEGEGNNIYIYPCVNGECFISYDAMLQENIDIKSQMAPPIPPVFHKLIIDGATFYLARRKISEVAAQGNPDLLNSWLSVVKMHEASFEKGKERYAVYATQRSEPAQQKGYNFFDEPESYS